MVRLIGAAVLAVALSFAGGLVWSGLFRLNMRIATGVPWSVIVMLGVIALSWRGLSGSGQLRAMLPDTSKWPWSVLAAVSVAVCLTGLVLLGFRIGHFSRNEFASSVDVRTLAMSMRLARVLMAASVAAFFEEVGFRGLLQPKLEQRVGKRVAIITTALLFYALHLGHGWARGDATTMLATAIPILTGGIFFGALAVFTGSIAPSIIAHALTDIALLPLEWAGRYNMTPVAATGVDAHFIVWSVISLIALGGTLYAFKRLSTNGARRRPANTHD